MFFSKSVLGVAALSLGHATDACLDAYSTTTKSESPNFTFALYDNDVLTCDVNIPAEDSGNADCGDGYFLDYEWLSGFDPIPITYHAPHGDFEFQIPQDNCSWELCSDRK